MKLLQLTTYNL